MRVSVDVGNRPRVVWSDDYEDWEVLSRSMVRARSS